MNRWPHGDPDAVVRDVLAGAAYRHVANSPASAPRPSLWGVLWAWLVQHVFDPLLSPLQRAFANAAGGASGRLLGVVFVVLALAVLALVAYRVALAYARSSRRHVRNDGDDISPATKRDAAAWRELAREAAARNDFTLAIAALFSASLALLDERTAIAFDAARTPNEYRRAVRRERVLAAPAFDQLAQRFVSAAYGRERPDAGAYAETDGAFDRLEPALRA